MEFGSECSVGGEERQNDPSATTSHFAQPPPMSVNNYSQSEEDEEEEFMPELSVDPVHIDLPNAVYTAFQAHPKFLARI